MWKKTNIFNRLDVCSVCVCICLSIQTSKHPAYKVIRFILQWNESGLNMPVENLSKLPWASPWQDVLHPVYNNPVNKFSRYPFESPYISIQNIKLYHFLTFEYLGSSSTAFVASWMALPYSSSLVCAKARFAQYTALRPFNSIAWLYSSMAWENLLAEWRNKGDRS